MLNFIFLQASQSLAEGVNLAGKAAKPAGIEMGFIDLAMK